MSPKQWGGRFKQELAKEAKSYSYSLLIDQVLFPFDIEVGIAHVTMLGKCGIIAKSESVKIQSGLKSVLKQYGSQDLSQYAGDYEDVHDFIQAKLEEEIGDTAKKLHTARSRNDLVVTSTKLYLKNKIPSLIQTFSSLQKSLLEFAKQNDGVMIPGYTHLQPAQMILLAHHLLAYVEKLERDKGRLSDALKRLDEMPLGVGSIAGTTLPIDRKQTVLQLGFQRISQNSLDSVGDRDFVVEVLSCLSIFFMHISRLCEDFILWNSNEFNFLTLSDEYSTGSSLMPQKKNPDMLELARGRTGKVYGALISVLTMMKGLPLSYNRDMQEDKQPLFDSLELSSQTAVVLSGLIQTASINEAACQKGAKNSFLFATDLLDYFVKRGLSFKDAHHLVGEVVLYSLEKDKQLSDISLNEWKEFSDVVDKTVYQVFDANQALQLRKADGSTGVAVVQKRLSYWTKKLGN